MSTLTASPNTFLKLLKKIPDLGEEAVKQTWSMVRFTKKFNDDQKKQLIKALKNNVHVQRRQAIKQKSLVIKELNENTKLLRTITSSLSDAEARKSRGRKSRGRKSRGRKSRGRKSRGRKSHGRKSHGRKTRRR
tara:strand:+ start:38131 stop:38532 length:402 start_codon:yes stop_codon:yes gene_type:complete